MESVHEIDDLRTRFEAKLSDLRGRRLMAVGYWDIHNYAPEPARWDYGDWHHAVMGVELVCDVGPATVTCTSTFYPYGVEVFQSPIRHSFDSPGTLIDRTAACQVVRAGGRISRNRSSAHDMVSRR